MVLPLLTRLLSQWDPFRSPEVHIEEVTRWRDIVPSYFDSIVWRAWMPPVRRAILSWDPRKTEEIIIFVSLWKSHLHQNIWDNVANDLILNKLQYQGKGQNVYSL